MIDTTGLPRTLSGRTAGSGGMTPIAQPPPNSSGAVLHEARGKAGGPRRPCWPDRPEDPRGSGSAVGAAGSGRRSRCRNCRRRRGGPRTDRRSRSGEATTLRPSAVTTSALRRLSQTKPNLRSSHPLPLPSARPEMPVVALRPPVIARPCAPVAWSNSPQFSPASKRAGARDRIDVDPLHAAQVDADAAVADRVAGHRVTAAIGRDRQPRARGRG